MAETTFDLIVVGGGPGGYVAAIRSAQLGMKTALVEAEHLGGICLNWGCIPTKALLRTAEIYHYATHGEQFGLKIEGVSVDLAAVVKAFARDRQAAQCRGRAFAEEEQGGGVRRFWQPRWRQTGARRLKVERDGKPAAQLTAKHIILATGARARALPGLEPDGKLVWTYKEAMVPKAIPKSLLVVGSGAIGMEFASFYSDLGAEVTVVEVA